MASQTDNLAVALIAREERGRQERSSLDSLLQELAEYTIPRKATFYDDVTPGVRRLRRVLDSTAPRALELFASFLYILLNNPSQQWVRLTVQSNPKLSRQVDVRAWLEHEAEAMQASFATSVAGVYLNLHKIYMDLGWAGTGVLYSEMDAQRRLRTRTYHMKDCVILEGESGTIDGMLRRFRLSPRQAKQRWPGVNLGRRIMQAEGAELDKPLRFMHAVLPVSDPLLQNERAGEHAFSSIWLNVEERERMAMGGYYEFPYQVPRWYTVDNDAWGRSQAMTVAPDIRMVNRMSDTILRGAEKIVDPPLVIPDGGMVSPVRLFPGGISYSEGVVDPKPLIPPGTSRIEVGNDLLVRRQDAIREGFFVPLFATPESPVKTATQVLQEDDERNRAVSPMLIRTQFELHQPFVSRVYNLRRRAGLLLEAPEALRNETIGVEYVSPLIVAQKQVEGLGVTRLFESAAPWAQVDPGVWDRYDVDAISEIIGEASGAPARIMRTREEALKVRKERAAVREKQEMAAMMLGQGGGADAAAKLITANARAKQAANA